MISRDNERHHRHPRLQTRIVIGVGSVALALSVVLALATFFMVRSSLLAERRSGAIIQTAANAQLVNTALRSDGVGEAQLLDSLRPQIQSLPLLERDGQWFTSSLQVGPDELPASLSQLVLAGSAASQRFTVGDQVMLGIGTPLPDGEAFYFEVFSLGQLNEELATLGRILATVGAVTTLAGLGLGSWIARRVTRPLGAVSEVAERITDGHLETRLDTSADRDLHRLTSSFNRMADSLQGRIERESRFAADVSHELRSPLTTLLTSVAVLENRRNELSPDGQEALGLLSSDVTRLERMVADLTEIAKHDAGSLEITWSYVTASELVLSVLRRLRVGETPIDVTRAAEDAIVRVDERRLERTITNLIDNAERYANGTTGIVIDATDRLVQIIVEDRGPGVPGSEKEIIFRRFSRGHKGRRANHGGSGLGLALAVENLSIMDGTVWVEDRPGGGSRFVVQLPRVRP